MAKRVRAGTGHKVELLLDSGAFGAWQLGEKINLKQYARFIKDNRDWIWNYVNVDVIPGYSKKLANGKRIGQVDKDNKEAIERAAQQGYENLQRLKDMDVSPIPIFHQYEHWDHLHRMIDDGETYIGISPYTRAGWRELDQWFSAVFKILRQRAPDMKTHGFGVMSLRMIYRFPWYTVDSTSWRMHFGRVIVPQLEHGEFNFAHDDERMFLSQYDGDSKDRSRYQNLGPVEKELVDRYLSECCGVNGPDAIHELMRRDRKIVRANAIYLLELQDQVRAHAIKPPAARPDASLVAHRQDFSIAFASNFSVVTNKTLTGLRAKRRLLSYFDLRKLLKDPDAYLREYVERGYVMRMDPEKYAQLEHKPRKPSIKTKRPTRLMMIS